MKSAIRSTNGIAILQVILLVSLLLMVVSVCLALFSPPSRQAKTLDTQRQIDLATIQQALEQYASNHSGTYPPTTPTADAFVELDNHQPQCFNCGLSEYQQSRTTDVPFTRDNWIPDIVDQGYLPTLPIDPQNGIGTAGLCLSQGWPRGYIYVSNGQDYKLIDFCSPTNGLNIDSGTTSPYCIGENKRVLVPNPSGHTPLESLADPKQPSFNYAIYSPAWACL